ncbi:hypothetical protein MKUB_24150 [Mycobacterium kubicae]|uniref:Xanthine dehydrogenase family protein subunit M n=1 Tax=Mycobacterium kubicae TaxID=120959 RepID=A0AAX1JG55_9MYCO|nr:xanthine dehydrogenase family protein subunit M [Mycobacterium kubicae]MCV7093629.1 xanthine dehydrogenase family protein subunit M [Mycobacterium kubicae]ORV96088.1 FAD-binding molybdopterin dehydrogenase [Mycobacterium kubicae]QNI11977.1 xanthine dehydrogenase family protein subunit M [Mycobacterium kubicae]QPI40202.1 xanthine dehydrogenase family protein subunit M [Mycobacterium kubicae]GFG64925.1 hypothetical protein MKUB_24150 [Mycobacterium kubicae]
MYQFHYSKAADEQSALRAGAGGARYIAGGTTLVDLMRETVERPEALVDINRLPYTSIEVQSGFLRVGSLARMADVIAHPLVRQQFPVISQSLTLSASAQLRNMASIGGNLLQRTRCLYFRDVSAACNKRVPGSGCSALEGRNRTHAILGVSRHCIATHPSDLAVALVALDAVVVARSTVGERRIPISQLYRQPDDSPQLEHNLQPGELIAAVEVPVTPEARRSGYLKVRDRESYEFALTSAAVAMDIAGGVIRNTRIAVGGVGTVPWRLPAVEAALHGRPPTPDVFRTVAAIAAEGARSSRENGFKIELLKRTVERQLNTVAAMP